MWSLTLILEILESAQDARETGKEPVEFTIKFAPRRPSVQVLLNLAQECSKIKPKLCFRNIEARSKSGGVSGNTQTDISGMMGQSLHHVLLELITEYSIYLSSCLFIYYFFFSLLCGRMMTTHPELSDYTAWWCTRNFPISSSSSHHSFLNDNQFTQQALEMKVFL